VTHGDFRLDNMLFGRTPGATPLAIVDWQSPALGQGPADVAYFLGTSLDPALRGQEERALLRVYRDVLKSYGVSLSEDALWRAYRRSSFAGLVMAVVASMIVGQTDRGDSMFMAMAQRSAVMARELEGLALLA
jgi:aminoglycoside phosphotransferase (APT) family kinase protein